MGEAVVEVGVGRHDPNGCPDRVSLWHAKTQGGRGRSGKEKGWTGGVVDNLVYSGKRESFGATGRERLDIVKEVVQEGGGVGLEKEREKGAKTRQERKALKKCEALLLSRSSLRVDTPTTDEDELSQSLES